MELMVIVLLFLMLGGAALQWGYDSRERMESPEWERRKHRSLW